MKKLATFAFIALSALLVGCSENSGPVEGKQYEQLPVNLATFRLPPVTEVFSLNCGHCRQMENEMPTIGKLTGQSIGKVHVTFNESAQIGAMIYYAAEMQLGKKPDHEMMNEMFAATQMGDGATLTDKKNALDHVFHSRGLTSPYDFDEQQQKQLFAAMQVADDITTQGQINAVPTFIVNGKYQVITSGHQDVASIAETINFLLQQP
ncbi:thiol:disulfide interchange protein DsbA/DsbL [Vibrio sinaloensis]|uniref:thiol:disulfide interchange protein DsbA/DsbL n=1 Tax=Photobacterium sp. (strain ATCC 43367) TaxID=379097 RepID=UPI0022AE961C|nr:thiol:disulfide interchange protein DsbA/DsbL [Vibrio sinaloensis]MCZ4292490.1 thiol:disulfide interchange protein DsbA/DsbL [Vibrio sinaloensis]